MTALPRIKIKKTTDKCMFYKVGSTDEFVPHGYNYVRLDNSVVQSKRGSPHRTFNTSFYNPSASESFLSQMKYDGYNVVRVFINWGRTWDSPDVLEPGEFGIAGPKYSSSLYTPYINNFIDFLKRATSKGIYVIPVLEFIPHNAWYMALANEASLPDIEGWNMCVMDPGYIAAKAAYVKDFITVIKGIDSSLLSTIFAWEIENEVHVLGDHKPFSLLSGRVMTADGMSYDMALPGGRQQAQDANIVHWANVVAAAVRCVDPVSLVTVGVFTYNSVDKAGPAGLPVDNNPDKRYPARPMTLHLYSTLDFIDIHTYPTGDGYSLITDLQSSEFSSMDKRLKPFILGEFGAYKSYYPDISQAAYAMRDHKLEAYSIGFSGSMYWTWDTDEQLDMWNGAANGGAINGVLV